MCVSHRSASQTVSSTSVPQPSPCSPLHSPSLFHAVAPVVVSRAHVCVNLASLVRHVRFVCVRMIVVAMVPVNRMVIASAMMNGLELDATFLHVQMAARVMVAANWMAAASVTHVGLDNSVRSSNVPMAAATMVNVYAHRPMTHIQHMRNVDVTLDSKVQTARNQSVSHVKRTAPCVRARVDVSSIKAAHMYAAAMLPTMVLTAATSIATIRAAIMVRVLVQLVLHRSVSVMKAGSVPTVIVPVSVIHPIASVVVSVCLDRRMHPSVNVRHHSVDPTAHSVFITAVDMVYARRMAVNVLAVGRVHYVIDVTIVIPRTVVDLVMVAASPIRMDSPSASVTTHGRTSTAYTVHSRATIMVSVMHKVDVRATRVGRVSTVIDLVTAPTTAVSAVYVSAMRSVTPFASVNPAMAARTVAPSYATRSALPIRLVWMMSVSASLVGWVIDVISGMTALKDAMAVACVCLTQRASPCVSVNQGGVVQAVNTSYVIVPAPIMVAASSRMVRSSARVMRVGVATTVRPSTAQRGITVVVTSMASVAWM